MESNEDVIEAGPDKRRSNSGETGGILAPEQIPIATSAPEPSPNYPHSLLQHNPLVYSIPDDPPVPPLQGAAFQPWPYGPQFPIGVHQGEFPNWPGGTFPSAPGWPGTHPPHVFQPDETYQYPIVSNDFGPNEAGPTQHLPLIPPGQADVLLYHIFS